MNGSCCAVYAAYRRNTAGLLLVCVSLISLSSVGSEYWPGFEDAPVWNSDSPVGSKPGPLKIQPPKSRICQVVVASSPMIVENGCGTRLMSMPAFAASDWNVATSCWKNVTPDT